MGLGSCVLSSALFNWTNVQHVNSSYNLQNPLKRASLTGSHRSEINEYLIERYVRFVETLDKATQVAIGQHVQRYLAGSAIERFYRQFYEEYDALEGHLSPKVDAFTASLFK